MLRSPWGWRSLRCVVGEKMQKGIYIDKLQPRNPPAPILDECEIMIQICIINHTGGLRGDRKCVAFEATVPFISRFLSLR